MMLFLLVLGLLAPRARADLSSFDADRAVALAHVNSDIPAFLHALPAEFRDHYVISPRPRGNQQGRPLFPRPMFFGENLIVAFNGCPAARGYDTIEMMDLRGATPKLIDLKFGAAGVVVRVQPDDCRRCHGAESRPLWPSGLERPRWAGFYGAGTSKWTGEREAELVAGFIAAHRNHPRYSALVDLPRVAPYANSFAQKGLYSANLDFEMIIARAVARQTFMYLSKHPNFRRARLPLLMVLSLIYVADAPALARIDLAEALAPLVAQPVDRIRAALAAHLVTVERATADLVRSNRRLLRDSLEIPTLDPDDLGAIGGNAVPRRMAAALAYLAELYGLTELELKMSTSRVAGAHAYPGNLPPLTGPAVFERMLFEATRAEAGLSLENVGRVSRVSRAHHRNVEYSSWASPADLRDGLARLASALGRDTFCGQLFF